MMPDIDGGQVAQHLSEDTKTKDIPIIFLTGMIKKEEEKQISGRIYLSKTSSALDAG